MVAEEQAEILSLADTRQWADALTAAGADDVYYTPEYLGSLEANGDGSARLFVYRHPRGAVVYPFLLRPVALAGADTGYYDISSPYGYSGPFVAAAPAHEQAVADGFIENFADYVKQQHIVSEFSRFHPLLANHDAFRGMALEHVGDTVSVNLELDGEKLWQSSFDGRTRTAVKKARELGVTVVFGTGEEQLCNFTDLYTQTMRRLGASAYYYFSEACFERLHAALAGDLGTFAEAWHEGVCIASILLLRGGRFLHYHLSATHPDHRRIPANNLLLAEAIEWGWSRNLTRLHLGGGLAPDDGLFRFKAGFSPDRAPYLVGKRIHDQAAYDELVRTRFPGEGRLDGTFGYFPYYRRP